MDIIIFIEAIDVGCREWVVDKGRMLQEVIVNAPVGLPHSTAPLRHLTPPNQQPHCAWAVIAKFL